jgi:hypothetical protein
MVRFGQGSVFFTVTPDDSNCFCIQVYVLSTCPEPPTCSSDLAYIDADYEMSHKLQQEYPGLCAFDFQQITELIFEHILGWDQAKQKTKLEGGAFRILDAWSDSIEERGRKMLHGHYILWVRNWSTLLLGLRSDVPSIRKKAATQLSQYIDTVLSTKLFRGSNSIIQMAYYYDCKSWTPRLPIICNDQSIRNLRYKHGESSYGNDTFLLCPDCEWVFNMDNLDADVLTKWFGSESNVERKLKLAVKPFAAQIDNPLTQTMCTKQDFMVHAANNLHASSHAHSFFKKGFECHNKIPDHPCRNTTIHFETENKLTWWSWTGTFDRNETFYVEPARHVIDIFMNQYQNRLSTILGCNTNVQCGIDGAHMHYATLYASKGTQQEDGLAYAQVAKTLYAQFCQQEEARNDPESLIEMVEVPTPQGEGIIHLTVDTNGHSLLAVNTDLINCISGSRITREPNEKSTIGTRNLSLRRGHNEWPQ